MQTKNKQKNKGFTLIELMVATSIFVVIMLASMGSLFTLLDASKNARALRTAMDNVNFAMESMTRSIRMGTNYICADSGTSVNMNNLDTASNCPSSDQGGTLVAFVPQPQGVIPATSRVVYKLGGTESDGTRSLLRCDDSGCVDIVSEGVNIERIKFFVKGSESNDNIQASVYIIMKGTVLVKGVPTSFALQTMASQRNF